MKTQIDLSRYWYIFRGGIAAPFFSWFGIFVLVMIFYTLNASAQMLGDVVWQQAAFFATGWWTTVFGGAVNLDEATLTLMPLTVTGIAMYASYQSWRSRGVATWGDVFAAALSWPTVVAVIALTGQAAGDWWFGAIGAFVLAWLTATWSARSTLLASLPAWAYLVRARPYIRWFGFGLLGLVGAVALAFIVAKFGAIIEIHGYYLTGVVGSIGLFLLQVSYLPAFVVWFLSWLVGAGFSVGTGTNFSIFGVESGPLPAVPLFGALPAPGTNMVWIFVALIVVACGFGVVASRKFAKDSRKTRLEHVRDAAIAVGVVTFGVSMVSFVAAGSIGPGRMAVTGPDPALTAGLTLLAIGLPFILGVFAAHKETVAFVKSRVKRSDDEGADNE